MAYDGRGAVAANSGTARAHVSRNLLSKDNQNLYNRGMTPELDYSAMLAVAVAEAREGLSEGGIPIGAAIFDSAGRLLGAGHNRRVQDGDPSMHGETNAFRNAGRQRSYRSLIMVTTLAPCWYCSGLVRQFGFGTVVVGEQRTFQGGVDWLRSLGVKVIDLDSSECVELLTDYIRANPEVWNEDIGEE
jgi:cytosine/creatinine deaminase